MSEPSVEEIVADLERQACYTWPVLPPEQIRALIADWRKRGEALEVARDWMVDEVGDSYRPRGRAVLAQVVAAITPQQ